MTLKILTARINAQFLKKTCLGVKRLFFLWVLFRIIRVFPKIKKRGFLEDTSEPGPETFRRCREGEEGLGGLKNLGI